MKPELVSGAELARRLGISRQALAAGVKRGRVAYQDAARRLFDAEKATATWRATEERLRVRSAPMSAADELLEARVLRERAEGALAQLKLRQAEGELCDAAGVERAALAYGAAVKEALLASPARVAASVRAAKSDSEAERILLHEAREVCRAVASFRPSRPTPSSTNPSPGDEE